MWPATSHQKFDHVGNTVHPLKLCVSTKRQCYKHRVHLFSSCCSPVLCWCGSQSAHRVQQLDLGCWGGDRSLTKMWDNSRWFHIFGQHESRLSTSFSYDQTLSRSSLKPSWISTTLIPSLCLPVAVELVRLDGQKTLWASIVSKSAALNPKHPFTSPILVTVFLPGAKKENVA